MEQCFDFEDTSFVKCFSPTITGSDIKKNMINEITEKYDHYEEYDPRKRYRREMRIDFGEGMKNYWTIRCTHCNHKRIKLVAFEEVIVKWNFPLTVGAILLVLCLMWCIFGLLM